MTIKVINPGLSTTVQDLGRNGYFHLGIPMGGAMDQMALRAANLLVGNSEDLAALEAVFIAPQLEFRTDTVVAVTGGEMPVKLDGVEQPTWTAFAVKRGQVLTFGYLVSGARVYIAVAGGIDVPLALGSRSTYRIGALGGFKGRALAKDDELPVGIGRPYRVAAIPENLRRRPGSPAEIRVLPGLYWHRITELSQGNFFDDEWKVAPEADRMGYRFKGGRSLDFVDREPPFGAGSDPSNIVDSCYSYGSIQVPSGTEPIVLHRDAVSGGGYFTIGAVISADMDLIGQLQPGTRTQFVKVDMDQALLARQDRASILGQLRTLIA